MSNASDGKKISLTKIRDNFYKCRDFELSHLWQRSIFLSAFLIFCFTSYGYLVGKSLDYCSLSSKMQILNEVICYLALLGIVFSIIWIKMAKGSKAWYEIYEGLIAEIENEAELEIPEKYRMGSQNDEVNGKVDCNLFSGNGGKYSVSKLNILIGMVLLFTWLLIIVFHYLFAIYLFETNRDCVHLIHVILLPVFLVLILMSAICNKWAKSSFL